MSGPVIAIGLDAADLGRIERLEAAGSMPTMAALRARSARGRLCSMPTGLSAMIWPKWFEGGHAGSWYFPKAWNPDRMCLEWVTATRGYPEPFWVDLDRQGARVCIVDVPQAPMQQLRHGLLVQGWQVHDLFFRGSHPKVLWQDLIDECGPPRLGPERYGPQSISSLLELRDEVLEATRQARLLTRRLRADGPFDLTVIVLGGLHRAGHYLWDLSQVDLSAASEEIRRILQNALDDIYIEVDRVIGDILDAAPDAATVILFSLHGMDRNGGWAESFASFSGNLAEPQGKVTNPSALQRIKRVVPPELAQRATAHLPDRLSNRLLEFTSSRSYDWKRTPWFTLPSDLFGFLRLNIAGRERDGIVAPGHQSAALEAELIDGFMQIEDFKGRKIVASVERTDDSIPEGDQLRRYLPDLLLLWDRFSANDTAGLRLHGRDLVRWEPGRHYASGRSGNHVPEGWFSAMGPGIKAGFDGTLHEVNQLVPSIYKLLNLNPPAQFVGSAIDAVAP